MRRRQTHLQAVEFGTSPFRGLGTWMHIDAPGLTSGSGLRTVWRSLLQSMSAYFGCATYRR